jgi:hypothetical protein
MNALLAFGAMLVLDFVWGRYTQYVVAKRVLASGVTAAVIVGCNAAVTLLVVHDPWTILPAAAGAFCGTVLAVRLHPR